MRYPNGLRKSSFQNKRTRESYSNRGMSLEEDINQTNKYYLTTDRAIIHKKPTPVQIVKVHYPKRSAAVITEGYFKQASTTDYNGLYRNKYIDFEAKETKNKTLFPLANIHEHQINHMKSIIAHGGICFMIIRFSLLNETYYLESELLFDSWNKKMNGGRKSIPYEEIKQHGYLIPWNFNKRVDYLSVIDKLYF
ncbi:Holliday junction resolvase RecU [Virgibacillus sp. W0430]|uniref:Holliday junction resolvase RecU n=1 Tax=Virgibacillus sp. W0430 TaxID=3391580 RepID=UPI003F47634E